MHHLSIICQSERVKVVSSDFSALFCLPTQTPVLENPPVNEILKFQNAARVNWFRCDINCIEVFIFYGFKCGCARVNGLCWCGLAVTNEPPRGQNTAAARLLLRGQGHSHILKLEVLLEGVHGDEPQLAWSDRAGKVEQRQRKKQNKPRIKSRILRKKNILWDNVV